MLALGTDQSEVLFAAAVLALQIEDVDAARRYLETLRESGTRPADTAFLLGQMEELADNPDQAINWYGQVSGDNATNAQVRIASIRARRGEIAAARDLLQQLRVQFPNQSITLYLIESELLRDQKLKDQAMEVLGVALAANADHPDLLYARAMLAVSMDRIDVLEQDLRRILVRDPDHADALNALGYTLADRTDRLDEAYRFIQRALQLRPEEPAILDSMGWVLYRMGDAAAAEPYLRQALEQVLDPEIAAHLGEVLWELGRHDEARLVWQRALDADPEHEYLLQVLGRYRFSHTGN
jgi:tetratricopeptide (TPR) repeat protein